MLEKELRPEVDRLTSQVYSAILTFNKFPETFKHIDRSDMLKADLALQEVTNMLQDAGAVVNYKRNPIFDEK